MESRGGGGDTCVLLVRDCWFVKGEEKKYPAQAAVNVRGRGGGCQSYVLSDKWVFTCLQPLPPPSCNKSWHLFVTYDCISDCLGHDSIPEPPLSRRWRDSEPDWWRNRGFVAQIHRSVQYYICRRYGGYQWACMCVCGGGGKKVWDVQSSALLLRWP